jgi:mannose-6-phosphate isomerase-like protein (cupin superfamily)
MSLPRDERPLVVPDDFEFSFVSGSSHWNSELIGGFQCRDLGLAAATGGEMCAVQFRSVARPPAPEWKTIDADFYLLYVLKGHARLENGSGKRINLSSGTVSYQRAPLKYRLHDQSSDFEMLEISIPSTNTGSSQSPHFEDPLGHSQYLSEQPDSFIKGEGGRRYFSYRDLRTKAISEGKIHTQVIRTEDIMPGGTGWHKHTKMCQFFYVLDGTAEFELAGEKPKRLEIGDAICIPKGRPHNVPSFSETYSILEMYIPGETDTVELDAP